MKTLHPAPGEGTPPVGAVKSMTEIRLGRAELRNSVVDWLNRSQSSRTGPHIDNIHFERSSAPDIVEVHLEIAGSSFENAEHITETFLDHLQETVENRRTREVDTSLLRSNDMRILSTGLAPA